MTAYTATKDPNDRILRGFDWSSVTAKYSSPAPTIVSSVWAEVPTNNLTLTTNAWDGVKTSVWIEGGTAGETYYIDNTVTFSNGLVQNRKIKVEVIDM